jgi:hypothetical protein
MISARTALTALTVIAAPPSANAAVTISTGTTQNMNCSGGTCEPTATNAVLDAGDLESDLSQFGNVRVMTTGNGVEANNIVVKAAFSSPDSTSLTLEAHKAITVDAAVSIGSGTAELELQSDTLDATQALSFGHKGHITFGSLSDIFGINGGIFTLVGSVQGLASAVAANPSGAFALANSYDASQDGTYSASPVSTTFSGTFEGSGNVISYLTINVPKERAARAGLFGWVFGGELRDIGVEHANVRVQGLVAAAGALVAQITDGIVSGSHSSGSVRSRGGTTSVGGLVGLSTSRGVVEGYIIDSFSNASVISRGPGSFVGGLVGDSAGGSVQLENSYATGSVTAGKDSYVGGLVGLASSVANSFATGTVTVGDYNNQGWPPASAGGLVGYYYDADGSPLTNSYSTGNVFAGQNTYVGGLVGLAWSGTIEYCFSTGAPMGGAGSYVGGLTGFNNSASFTDTYWDTDTSGITNLSQGAGNIANDPGITGLSTAQLQSGLPSGFDPKIWAEDPNINNGFPYLINNPPPK